jgi:hypothetical protein
MLDMPFCAAPRQKFNSTQLQCLHPGCHRWFKATSARTKHYHRYHGPQVAMLSAARELSPDEPSSSRFTPEIPLTDVPMLEHNMSPDQGSQRSGFSHSSVQTTSHQFLPSNGPSQRQSSMPLYDHRVVHHLLLNGMYVYLLYVFALTSCSYRETL